MTRRIAAFVLSLGLSLSVLHAHVVVRPSESAAGGEQIYTMRVPTEGTVATTSVELEIPAGLHIVQVVRGEDFAFEVRKDGDRIMAITWTRTIQPKAFALFTFVAHNPASGVLQWKAHQTFADGSARHWIGEPGSKEPASVTKIVFTEGASPTPAGPAHKH